MPNFFLPVATLPLGFEGPQISIDLVALVPPTGLDRHLTFICTGNFIGVVAVEGSTDNANWSVLTEFISGIDADDEPGPKLEFSPQITDNATVRFLRANVRGQIIEITKISVAGEQNCDCASSISENLINGGTALVVGEIVRLFGANLTVIRSKADIPANAAGTIGVTRDAIPAAATGAVINAGMATMLLDAALVPVVGDTLYISAVTAGRATNVPPVNAYAVGTIKDTSLYATTNTVVADFTVPASITSSTANEVAMWDINSSRFFLIDYDGGNDANVGFTDVFPIVPAGLAKKTFEGFKTIFPRLGNGRSAYIIIKNRAAGATYLKVDGVTAAPFNLSNTVGYNFLSITGSTDLTLSTTDFVRRGFITASAGPNGDGSFTVDVGPTTTTFPVVGGGLLADPGLVGFRIRFTSGAQINKIARINGNTAIVITTSDSLPGAPVAGDTFMIERAGVRFSTYVDNVICNGAGAPITAYGIATTVSMKLGSLGSGTCQYSYMEQLAVDGAAVTLNDGSQFVTVAYLRSASTVQFQCYNLFCVGTTLLHTVGESSFDSVKLGAGFTGFYNRPGTTVICQSLELIGGVGAARTGSEFGSSTIGNVKARLNGTLKIKGNIQVRCVDVNNCAGVPCFSFLSVGSVARLDEVVSSIGGNTDVVVDVTGSVGSTVELGTESGVTATATLGDIRLSGPAITSIAALATVGVRDNFGNNVIAAAGFSSLCALFSNQSGSALLVGNIVRSNGTTGQITKAKADTAVNATGVRAVAITPAASAANGYFAAAEELWIKFDGAPTINNMSYLSDVNSGQARDTPPTLAATNQKLRLGYIGKVSGTLGLVAWRPELVPITSDGVAP